MNLLLPSASGLPAQPAPGYEDPLESWFREAFGLHEERLDTVAEAMIDDGFAPDPAWALASLAYLRYGGVPVGDLCRDEHARWALARLRQSLGPACAAAQAEPTDRTVLARRRRQPNFSVNHIRLPDRRVEVVCACEHPRVVLLGNALSDAECDAVIALAQPHLTVSRVVSPQSGRLMLDTGSRTSLSTLLPAPMSPAQQRIEQRFAALAGVPASHCDGLSVACFGVGGRVPPRQEFLSPQALASLGNTEPSGQRVATVLLYLNHTEAGGGTWFAEHGLTVRPIKGQAVYYEYQHLDGSPDVGNLHAGQPVLQGEQWIATLCFRAGPVDRAALPPEPGEA